MVAEIKGTMSIRQQAEQEVAKETAEKAKTALVKKLRELQAAKSIVANIEREVNDLELSIQEGSFVG